MLTNFILPSFESAGLSDQEENFKIDLYFLSSGCHHWSGTILAIFVESHLGNIPVMFDRN